MSPIFITQVLLWFWSIGIELELNQFDFQELWTKLELNQNPFKGEENWIRIKWKLYFCIEITLSYTIELKMQIF